MTSVRFVHAADLHLVEGQDCEYSFAVLAEILAKTKEVGAKYLVVSGDLFDSYRDAENLRARFREIVTGAKGAFEIIYAPGNHEELHAGAGGLTKLDLGAVTVAHAKPFSVVSRPGVEFLCVPHQPDYDGYQKWNLPAPTCTRVAVAHGLVTGMGIYAGPEDEETQIKAGAIDPDLFERFGVAYAALGHIHRRLPDDVTGARVCYPGSARVWRHHEYGQRSVLLVEAGDPCRVEAIGLDAAGQYRRYEVPLDLDGTTDVAEKHGGTWSTADWIHLRLAGLVEDENVVAELEKRIHAEWDGRVRRIEIDRDEVTPVAGIASHPLARSFLKAWEAKEPAAGGERERRRWMVARRLGLAAIADRLGALS
jgi:exonuclease SbcD